LLGKAAPPLSGMVRLLDDSHIERGTASLVRGSVNGFDLVRLQAEGC